MVDVTGGPLLVRTAMDRTLGGSRFVCPASRAITGGVLELLPAKDLDHGGPLETLPATRALPGGSRVVLPRPPFVRTATSVSGSFERSVPAAIVPLGPAMPSFDVVSQVQHHEVDNAFNQASKEIGQRYDFKDTDTSLEKTSEGIVIRSGSEDRAKAALVVLQDKLVKRKVSLRFTEPGKPESSGKSTRILVKIKDGIEVEKAKKIVQLIKDAKLKVQGSIMESQVRVSGKNRDDLQSVIQMLRGQDLGLELQFINMRE